ncbi:hypothetical protein [Terrimonas sp.]|uniref:hypothetical protein n=1 Tax=Terrimonas sp. TaxID=1914338 RepID=UPI00105725AE|nr:hypothetical protein [Terrimonas sp.]
MKFLMLFLFVGFLTISCNNTPDNTDMSADSTNVSPAPADTTVTDPVTRTDSTQKADTIK